MTIIWTINVQVNTLALSNLEGSGSWDSPVGSGKVFLDDVRITAVSNEIGGKVFTGNDSNFNLTVGVNDKVKWVLSEINPIVENGRTVVMYGFEKGSNWKEAFTDPSSTQTPSAFAHLIRGFDSIAKPTGDFFAISDALISIPETTVIPRPKAVTVTYHMKLLLLDIKHIDNPTIIKYIQIDPKLTVKL